MEVQTCACFGASILIFTDMLGFFHVWHEQRVSGAGVEPVIWVLIIIIVAGMTVFTLFSLIYLMIQAM